MDTDIFEQFPDRETFDKYWNENYQPVTYEDVREAFTDFVKSADGHIYLSDYEEKGLISREDFKENLSQEAQFTFEDGVRALRGVKAYRKRRCIGGADVSRDVSRALCRVSGQTV